MAIESVVFDLGNVLIDWNPSYVFDTLFDDEDQKKHFFEHICTHDWNEKQDEGRPLKEATETLSQEYPEWRPYIEAYYGRWTEMLGGPIVGTVEILQELKHAGNIRLYALTNWSAELFPIALERYEFLHWFDGRLVSGEEKMKKPAPEFYQLLVDRFKLDLSKTVFIDDNLRNVQAAEIFGLPTIRFENPDQLRTGLRALGLPVKE